MSMSFEIRYKGNDFVTNMQIFEQLFFKKNIIFLVKPFFPLFLGCIGLPY